MHTYFNTSRACVALVFLGVSIQAFAQAQAADDQKAKAQAIGQSLTNAFDLRVRLTSEVVQGQSKPEQALADLRKANSPSGLQLDDPDADFASGALDIGRRLVAARKTTEAEVFFRAVDQSLTSALGRAIKDQATARATLLLQRALVRSEYLNAVQQAKADLDEATALDPKSPDLQKAKVRFARMNAQAGFANPKG